ncbi:MAG: hypothetical protein DDT33_01083 [Firmicutes bacterium]|nr:hypothetical protein [Bacillota bacterium]
MLFLINEFNLGEKILVLDPFCGTGTTLLACKEAGISALGVDLLPLSVFVTNTKLLDFDSNSLQLAWTKFRERESDEVSDADIPDTPLLKRVFAKEVLKEILALKAKISSIDEPSARNFFLLCLLSILDKVSLAKKDGGFLRFSRSKQILPFKKAFSSQAELMCSDLGNLSFGAKDGVWMACQGDARRLSFKSESFDAVITSPPYLNRHDYTRVYALELLVGFLTNEAELKKLRYYSIRSHVEAREKLDADGFKSPEKLDGILSQLTCGSLPNPLVIPMIRGYFEDIYLTFKELYKVVKRGGKMSFVVGNVRYSGVTIPVDTLLAEIAEDVGFSLEKIIVARYRGNSPQQMGKFGREPSRESIIIWRK